MNGETNKKRNENNSTKNLTEYTRIEIKSKSLAVQILHYGVWKNNSHSAWHDFTHGSCCVFHLLFWLLHGKHVFHLGYLIHWLL